MCWNQGDWRFYKYYKEWQWKTYLLAKDICKVEKMDVLHQLNMIGFREPGYLWKLSQENGGAVRMGAYRWSETVSYGLPAGCWLENESIQPLEELPEYLATEA